MSPRSETPTSTRNWVMGVLSAIVSLVFVATVIGAYTSVTNAEKQLAVMNVNISSLAAAIADIKVEMLAVKQRVEAGTLDRWAKSDHNEYAARVQKALDDIARELDERQRRLDALEAKAGIAPR